MSHLKSIVQPLRAFWADPPQRRVLMWVLVAVGAVILVYGAVQAVRAQLDYMDRGDKLNAAEKQAEAFEQSLGLTYNPGDVSTAADATPTVAATPAGDATAEATSEGEATPLIGATPAATPVAEAAAPSKGDPELSQSDAMLVLTLRSQVRKAEDAKIQAYNRRAGALQIIGIGLIVLALAYLVAPENKQRPTPDGVSSGDLPS